MGLEPHLVLMLLHRGSQSPFGVVKNVYGN
jgi:hypothetical protein